MDELKIQLKRLWKDTFGDKEKYVDLISEAYFVENNVEFNVGSSGEVVSALWTMAYKFYDELDARYFNGLYLCGLATRKEYRGRGMMKELMKKIEDKAKSFGFDFCFLIPADDNLRRFYEALGYESMRGKYIYKIDFKKINYEYLKNSDKNKTNIFQIEENEIKGSDLILNRETNNRCSVSELCVSYDECIRFISKRHRPDISKFKKVDLNVFDDDFDLYDDKVKCKKLKEAYELLNEWERTRYPLSLIHSPRDFVVAIRECNISGGSVFLMQNCDCKPIALVFCYRREEVDAIDLHFAAIQSEDSLAIMLLYLKLCYFHDVSTVRLNLHPSGYDFRLDSSRLMGSVLFNDYELNSGYSLRLEKETPLSQDYGMIKWVNGSRGEAILTGVSDINSKVNSQKDKSVVELIECKRNIQFCDNNKEELTYVGIGDSKDACMAEKGDLNDLTLENCKCNLSQFNFLNISLMLD